MLTINWKVILIRQHCNPPAALDKCEQNHLRLRKWIRSRAIVVRDGMIGGIGSKLVPHCGGRDMGLQPSLGKVTVLEECKNSVLVSATVFISGHIVGAAFTQAAP